MSGVLEGAAEMTLGQVLRRVARAQPKAVALRWGRKVITYEALDWQVGAMARGLLRIGVERGEVLGLLIGKRPEMVILFLAAARVGAIVAPINHKLPSPQVKAQLRQGGIRRAIIGPGMLEVAASLGDCLEFKSCIFCRGSLSPWAFTFEELLEWGPGPLGRSPQPDDVVYLNYTSGSTGGPKGAETTHAQLQANALSTIRALGMTSGDTFLGLFTSFSHPHELFHRTLNLGGASVLLESWNPRIIAQAIARHRVTWVMAVPSLYEMMLRRDLSELDLSCLRILEAGGAYVSAESLQAFEAHFGVNFLPVWGSTETTGVAIALTPAADRPEGALGRPCPGYTVAVIDPEGVRVSPGEVGELVVRGPGVIQSYRGLPEATEARRVEVEGERYFRTGDLVSQDGEGYLHFKSRRAEMLKVGGLRVYPLEVELALKRHPDVLEAVVVREVDTIRGEVPRAVVTLSPGAEAGPAELRAHCLRELAGYKVPRTLEIWPQIPTLPNGKVDRKAVAQPRSP